MPLHIAQQGERALDGFTEHCGKARLAVVALVAVCQPHGDVTHDNGTVVDGRAVVLVFEENAGEVQAVAKKIIIVDAMVLGDAPKESVDACAGTLGGVHKHQWVLRTWGTTWPEPAP